MQAGLVPRTLSWFEWGLLRIYLVKQNASRNIIKKGAHNTNYNLHLRYTKYVTLQCTLHQLQKLGLRSSLKLYSEEMFCRLLVRVFHSFAPRSVRNLEI